jgi:hypothetical protein
VYWSAPLTHGHRPHAAFGLALALKGRESFNPPRSSCPGGSVIICWLLAAEDRLAWRQLMPRLPPHKLLGVGPLAAAATFARAVQLTASSAAVDRHHTPVELPRLCFPRHTAISPTAPAEQIDQRNGQAYRQPSERTSGC